MAVQESMKLDSIYVGPYLPLFSNIELITISDRGEVVRCSLVLANPPVARTSRATTFSMFVLPSWTKLLAL